MTLTQYHRNLVDEKTRSAPHLYEKEYKDFALSEFNSESVSKAPWSIIPLMLLNIIDEVGLISLTSLQQTTEGRIE